MERTLLLVDDDKNILSSLVRVLHSEGFHILTAESGEEALQLLETNAVGVVVSDQRMPYMTGSELLTRIRAIYPETVRIILSAFVELDDITHAINGGAIYKLLFKPVENKILIESINEAFDKYELVSENKRLSRMLKEVNGQLTLNNIDLEQKVDEKVSQIAKMTHFDVLTGMPNRLLFLDRLGQALAVASRDNHPVGIMFMDINNFKSINDTFDHVVGDLFLKMIADRLKLGIRQSDTVSRFNGDEFTFILPGVNAKSGVVAIADKLLEVFDEPFYFEGREVFLTASVGISLYPNDGDDADVLLRNAGASRYYAKKETGNTYKFYTQNMNDRAFESLSMENSLRRALERDEFELYYQPQYEVESRDLLGFEALLRWQHPKHGMMSPVEFIPILEKTGLIIPVGLWVIRTACQQMKAWSDGGLQPLRMALNTSAVQFSKGDFIEAVAQIIDETGIDVAVSVLEIEITESLIMSNVEHVIETMQGIRDLGIRLSIDDFGTGYSSLSYLKRFPIQSLKIDRSFVAELEVNTDGQAIVRAIIAMAHALNLEVIAEGVETIGQMEFLAEHDCDLVQGFMLGKPMAANAASHLLKENLSNIKTVQSLVSK